MIAFRDLITREWHHRPRLLVFLLLAVISLIAYGNALPNSFHFDDIDGIVLNPSLRDLRNVPSYFTNPTLFRFERIDWRPFLQITYALNYAMGGPNPTLFRLVNLFFHIGTAFLIFLITAEMARRSPAPSLTPSSIPTSSLGLIGAALFAVHTTNAESVNYIWARSSILAAFFYLLSFYCFLRGPFSDSNNRRPWHLGALAAFALGIATKVTAITLPATLFLYEILFLNPAGQNPLRLYRSEPWKLRKYIPIVILFLAYIALRIAMLPRTAFGVSVAPTSRITHTSYLLTQFRAWVYYLKLYLWPHPLIFDFPGFGWSYSLSDIRVLLSLGLIVALLATAWWLRKRQPLLSFFIFWFFIALLPEGSIFPLRDAVVGYRPYQAYIGTSVAAAILSFKVGMWLWGKRKRGDAPGSFSPAYSLVLGLVLAALTGATILRNLDWRDQVTLWSDVIHKDPTNARGYMSLGLEYVQRENYEEAEAMLEKAVRLAPRSSQAYMYRGYLNLLLSRYEQALSDLSTAIELRPGQPFSFLHRGDLYRKTGRYDEALRDYRSALRLNPSFPDAYFGIAMVHWEKKELQQSTAACRKLLELDPYNQRGYGCLGSLLMHQNLFNEALKVYSDGVTRFPKDGYLWYGLATAFEEIGRYQEAQDAYAKSSLLMR